MKTKLINLIAKYSLDKVLLMLFRPKKNMRNDLEKNLSRIIKDIGIYNITSIILDMEENELNAIQVNTFNKKYKIDLKEDKKSIYIYEEYGDKDFEYYTGRYKTNSNNTKRLDSYRLQNETFGYGYRVNSYYRKAENGDITYFRINSYLEQGKIWFECGDKDCGGSCKFDIKSQTFSTIKQHRLEYCEHTYLSNRKLDRVKHYMDLLRKYPDIKEMVIFKVPPDDKTIDKTEFEMKRKKKGKDNNGNNKEKYLLTL